MLLAGELTKERVVVDHETVRTWLIAAGQRTVRRRGQKHGQWRERSCALGRWFCSWIGRLAPRLESATASQGRLDGDGGRRDEPEAGAILGGRGVPPAGKRRRV